jgi:peptidoglycan/LPS O-acetylase OafA/YrhL
LRAIAVALVVLAHAGFAGFAGGYIGVDVFFVLSGYLISGLLIDEYSSSGAIRYGRFLARRLRRLLPALLVMLVVVFVAASQLLSAYELRMQSGSLPYAASWTSNIFFAVVERDYFSALQAEDLFLHTWSLGVEEQFYIFWPWVLLLTFSLSKPGSPHVNVRNRILIVLALAFVASLALELYWAFTRPLYSFYFMPSRIWQFALGAAVFVLRNAEVSRQEAEPGTRPRLLFSQGSAYLGLLLILGSAITLQTDTNYPGYSALFPSLGAALVIAAGTVAMPGVNALLATKPMVWLGDRSYSLYLWHWPLLILGNSYGLTDSLLGTAALIGGSVILATLSYRFIELPFWRGRFSTTPMTRTIAVSVAAIAIVMASYQGIRTGIPRLADPPTSANAYDPRVDASPLIYSANSHCDTGHFSSQIVPCAIGTRGADKLAVLIGDSIGAQWSTLVSAIWESPDWQILVLTKSACAIVDENYHYAKIGGPYHVCTEWRNAVLDYIESIEPDVILIGSSADYEFSDQQWLQGSSRVLSRVSGAAKQVVVIQPNPGLSFDGPSCLEEPYRFSIRLKDSKRECEEALSSSQTAHVGKLIDQAATSFDNVHTLDLGDLVCPGARCAAESTDGTIVYRDSQHLTMSFVNSLVPDALDRLVGMGVAH